MVVEGERLAGAIRCGGGGAGGGEEDGGVVPTWELKEGVGMVLAGSDGLA